MIALGLTYFNTKNRFVSGLILLPLKEGLNLTLCWSSRDIAEWFTPDDIMRLIELVRPDLLLLRVGFLMCEESSKTLSRFQTVVYNLISWESITNTPEWIDKQIPTILSKNAFRKKISLNAYDSESITQAYCYLVSAVCFSLALKYAGTWNEQTATVIVTIRLIKRDSWSLFCL